MFQTKIIAHSISPQGKEILTWELSYPRFIHGEVMTHKMLSKNAASSRAIPVQKVIDMVRENPAMPVHWGKNQTGMQAEKELDLPERAKTQQEWLLAMDSAIIHAKKMNEAGAHKQIINRILEPFQWMKTVMTGTEWANFYWLRNHPDAQPEFQHLAKMMWKEYQKSGPILLYPGEWHLPYYNKGFWTKDSPDSLEDAMAISMSCCAQVSYRVLDDTLEKAKRVVERLNLEGKNGEPVHASPSEHQATPIKETVEHGVFEEMINVQGYIDTWEDGVTAYHKELGFMSGNLAGWIQKRQLIKGSAVW